mmetsp:Transcript_4139/g.12205  ORF Transcript_4139/g.12205 Transcript_4139/m.12205 type:complete len:246 (+) Transcript_4139:207-944(+)
MSLGRVIHAKTAADIPREAVDGLPTTVYWDICGLGQCPRYALELAAVPYVDVRIDAGDPDSDEYKKAWLRDAKPDMGDLPFPNLPYYMDVESVAPKGVKLSQSNAILRFLGRRYGLYGCHQHLTDLVLDQATDLDNSITGPCYRDPDALVALARDTLPEKLDAWVAMLGDKRFMTGDVCGIGDLKAYEAFRKILIIEEEHTKTEVLKARPTLMAFVDRVHGKFGAFRASKHAIERPLNNPHAKFK